MPINPTPEYLEYPYTVAVSPKLDIGLNILVQIQDSGSGVTEEQMDTVLQSLVDLLQTWEFRNPEIDVVGVKNQLAQYTAHPTPAS